jgi:3-oxoacyl-[acyl-carrier protein] reductase
MDLGLLNKTVLITGASSGIGAAAARVFAEEGAHVAISYGQNRAGAEAAAAAVRALGRETCLCPMDLSNPESIRAAVKGLPERFQRLDSLVLCAGKNVVTPLGQISAEEWHAVIEINLSGPFFLVQALEAHFNEGASIVAVSSVAAKAGLINLTKSLARALAPRVRVNGVAPGITLTAMGEDTVASLPADYAQKKLLVQRYATPDEIARCIVFTASPLTGFMTGATIDINGGRDLR